MPYLEQYIEPLLVRQNDPQRTQQVRCGREKQPIER